MVEGEQEVMIVRQVGRQLDLDLLVEIRRLAVVRDGRVGVVRELWAAGFTHDALDRCGGSPGKEGMIQLRTRRCKAFRGKILQGILPVTL